MSSSTTSRAIVGSYFITILLLLFISFINHACDAYHAYIVEVNGYDERGGRIARTVDAGATWELVAAPSLTNTHFEAVSMVSFNDTFSLTTVGSDESVFRIVPRESAQYQLWSPLPELGLNLLTERNGVALSAPLSKVASGSFSLHDALHLDEVNAFAVGVRSILLQSEDGGNSWQEKYFEGTQDFNSISLKYNDDNSNFAGFIVGNIGVLQMTEDSGKTWQEKHIYQSANSTAAVESLFGVYGFSYDHFIVVGSYGFIAVTTDRNTWRLIDSGTKEHIFRINFVGPDHAVGFAVGANDLLLRTEDHGETWQQAYIFRASGMVTNSRINNIVMLDAQLGYAAYRNTLLVTGDGGKTWTQGQPIVVGNHMMNCISDVAVVKAPVFTPSFTHATLSIYIDELGVQSTLIPFALTIKNTGTADLKILDVQFEGLPLSSFSGQVTGNGGASGDINTGSSGLDGTATANNDSTTGTVPVAGSIYRNDIFFTGDDPIGQVFTPEGETKAYTLEWDSDGYQSVNSPMTASIVFIHNGPTKKSIVTLALLLYDLKADVQESWLDTYWPVFPALALMIIFAVFNCLRARHHRITEYNRKHQEKYHLSFFRFWCCAQNKWHSDDSRFWIDEYSSSEWSSDFSDSSGSSSTYSGSSGSYDSDSGDSDDSTSSEGSIYQDEDINSDGSVRNRTTGKKKKVADF